MLILSLKLQVYWKTLDMLISDKNLDNVFFVKVLWEGLSRQKLLMMKLFIIAYTNQH